MMHWTMRVCPGCLILNHKKLYWVCDHCIFFFFSLSNSLLSCVQGRVHSGVYLPASVIIPVQLGSIEDLPTEK